MSGPIIYWFRQDLRLDDLPGLTAAHARGDGVLAVFVLDDSAAGKWATGAASRWWLHHSLQSLRQSLLARGSDLLLLHGDTLELLPRLARETAAAGIYCSRCIEPHNIRLEHALAAACEQQGTPLRRFGGSLLYEPETIRTGQGTPFKVFTPFWRRCRQQPPPALPGPPDIPRWVTPPKPGLALEELQLLPSGPDWAADWGSLWRPGEAGAAQALRHFLENLVAHYPRQRDHPGLAATSRLSPHLHWGEIAPRRVWHTAQALAGGSPGDAQGIDKFLSELGWREFCQHLLFHYPDLPDNPFRPLFERFPWASDDEQLRRWQRGQTGYPIVDAGMRELWATGFMHNRVRMLTASFLTKHLRLPWQLGQAWFWNTLVDADLANNASGWQWCAGSGADAAPYFRIFNPTLQGKKFDAGGDYVRRWVPELAALPDRHLHEPVAAPEDVLRTAGVTLGGNYPMPVVEHTAARRAALDAWEILRMLD